jgi:hypothetical protein
LFCSQFCPGNSFREAFVMDITRESEEDELQCGNILRASRVSINNKSRSRSTIKTRSNSLKSIGYTTED